MVKKTNFFNIAPFPSNSPPIASSRDVSHTKVKSDFSLEQYFFYKVAIKARRCTINTAVHVLHVQLYAEYNYRA